MPIWDSRMQLTFNAAKCKILHIEKDNPKHKYTIEVNNKRHQLEVEKRDIGVIIDNKLSFKEHIHTITKSANTKLGMSKKTSTHCNDKRFINMYRTIVRPSLEYNGAVWSPHLKGLNEEID